MAFTASGVFQEWLVQVLKKSGTSYGGIASGSDTIKAALYNNSITPNKNDTLANSAYNAGQWLVANEQSGTNWASGGQTIAGIAVAGSSGTVSVTATNTASSGSTTLSSVYGCLVYDSTISGGSVAKQGICYNYFGGAQAVTAGTFTIVWNASGIFTMTN